jgi:hypothetical protein
LKGIARMIARNRAIERANAFKFYYPER